MTKIKGDDLNEISSFCTIDFFSHEIMNSNIVKGLESNYNLQSSYKIAIDEVLIQFMQTGTIKVEIFYVKKNEAFYVNKLIKIMFNYY